MNLTVNASLSSFLQAFTRLSKREARVLYNQTSAWMIMRIIKLGGSFCSSHFCLKSPIQCLRVSKRNYWNRVRICLNSYRTVIEHQNSCYDRKTSSYRRASALKKNFFRIFHSFSQPPETRCLIRCCEERKIERQTTQSARWLTKREETSVNQKLRNC